MGTKSMKAGARCVITVAARPSNAGHEDELRVKQLGALCIIDPKETSHQLLANVASRPWKF